MTTKAHELSALAFRGDWNSLLPILKGNRHLVNIASEPKGYTPLHQAAWHGASLGVIGQLLRMGASRRARTFSKRQNAADIATEKHPDREGLRFVLTARRATVAQLLRKVLAQNRGLFSDCDGNQIIADRLISCFGVQPCPHSIPELEQQLQSAFYTLTGSSMESHDRIHIEITDSFNMVADGRFWISRVMPLVRQCASEADDFVLEREWAVMSDLFEPAPRSWGLRGTLFLWLEMRQVLCQVPIPENPEEIDEVIAAAFCTLTHQSLSPRADVFVSRFARGGMSSGHVDGQFWVEDFCPLLRNRARWLQEVWGTS
jgi:hypothetical protein